MGCVEGVIFSRKRVISMWYIILYVYTLDSPLIRKKTMSRSSASAKLSEHKWPSTTASTIIFSSSDSTNTQG